MKLAPSYTPLPLGFEGEFIHPSYKDFMCVPYPQDGVTLVAFCGLGSDGTFNVVTKGERGGTGDWHTFDSALMAAAWVWAKIESYQQGNPETGNVEQAQQDGLVG